MMSEMELSERTLKRRRGNISLALLLFATREPDPDREVSLELPFPLALDEREDMVNEDTADCFDLASLSSSLTWFPVPLTGTLLLVDCDDEAGLELTS